ncbi:hypothetical protein [Flammeovirga aprica]|uniref:Uncharacterized protein n=1 Tax=Flammeovirga aprica JL-4 TaxID=694437 RepID=A0A7X9RVT1_9BACT|nr:hypothetical protein [Flammeovirga aprica]NME69608.1 hypothetical protein [Flammeovirga aprica JL-4]
MKKYLFILVALLVTLTSFAQDGKLNKKQKKAKHFSEALAEKYNLDEAKTKEVYELKLTQMNTSGKISKKKKNGEITPEEAKAENRKNSKSTSNALMKICGATDKKAFNAELKALNQELKQVK